jgi:hypothetical protein
LVEPKLFWGDVWVELVVAALAPPRRPEIAAVRTRVFIDFVIKVLLVVLAVFRSSSTELPITDAGSQ